MTADEQPQTQAETPYLPGIGRPTRVILFGSYARGDVRDGSDLDFVAVLSKVASRLSEMVRLRGLLRPLRVLADVLVYSEEQVDEWGTSPARSCSRSLTKVEPCMPPPEAGPAELLLRKAGYDLTVVEKMVDGEGCPPRSSVSLLSSAARRHSSSY